MMRGVTTAAAPVTPPLHDPRDLAAARERLQEVFGYDEFLPGQAQVVASVLSGRDTLAVLPTGGGKSVCFQLPALCLDGLTLVVSPLLALMKDQVDALSLNGVAAAAINSTVPPEEQADILRRAAEGELRLLYVAPERFSAGRFNAALRGVKVARLAIDEAHCISQWGHNFRLDYLELGTVRARFGNPPIVALTATADEHVRSDIVTLLGLREPDIHIAGFDRPNLRFHAIRMRGKKEKLEQITEWLKALDGEASAIVYCATRKNVESLAMALQRKRIRCARYHAGMPKEDRERIQDAFARDSVRIIIATNAFGLGIDKPDVRLVIHHDLPGSIEAYYQEAGRAGRDGDAAECVLCYAPSDQRLRKFFIEKDHPPASGVVGVYRDLVEHKGAWVLITDLVVRHGPGVNAAIQALVESGLVERRGGSARALRPNGEDAIDLANIEEHHDRAMAKLNAMQSYAKSATCLRARILDYFGETRGARSCGNCGPCLTPTHRTKTASPEALLFMELHALRRRLAEEEGVPPYLIFNDGTLHEMVEKRPTNITSFLRVHGVGHVKADRYGAAFLEVIRAAEGPAPQELEEGRSDPHNSEPWSEEDRRMLAMRDRGNTVEEIANRLQRPPDDIRSRLRQLDRNPKERASQEQVAHGPEEPSGAARPRAIREKHPRAYELWIREEELRLLAMLDRGGTVEEIASELQRQPSAIRARLRHLGRDEPPPLLA